MRFVTRRITVREGAPVKKVYFVGVGGIGNSAIAKMMLAQGKVVSGSDLVPSEITAALEKLGVKINIGHRAENLNKDTDLVIYSPAVPENNPERQQAIKLKIPQFSYPEFLGQLSKEKFTIAVSGTNGKSTTTAMLGLILEAAGFDPLVIVGSKVAQWNGNLRLPSQEAICNLNIRNRFVMRIRTAQSFVVEGCEWRAHMLNLEPKIIILTNLEEDHLDYYRDINHIIATFQKYIEKLPKNGILILNVDDPNLLKLRPKCRVITYGIRNKAEVMAKNIEIDQGFQKFELIRRSDLLNYKNKKIRPLKIKLKIPGQFNVYNSLAVIACALNLGVKIEIIKEVLESFSGIWRRFEISSIQHPRRSRFATLQGKPVSSIIVSDYAHHPTAVAGTIRAAREFFPGRRLIAVFQPHHHNRTKRLFNDFVKSFDEADITIISEIYDVAGRENKQDIDISSKDLVKSIRMRMRLNANKNGNLKEIIYAANLEDTKNQLLKIIQPNDVILVMGAGDIYKIISNLKIQKPKL